MARYWGPKIRIDSTWLREYRPRDAVKDLCYTRWLGNDAAHWEAEVQQVLRKIYSSKSGRLLLSLINGTPTHGSRRRRGQSPLMCVIMPIHAAAFQQTRAKPVSFEKAMKKGSIVRVLPDNNNSVVFPTQEVIPPHAKLLTGTGDGSTVRIFYHPATWTAHSQIIGLDTQRLFTEQAHDTAWPIDQGAGLDTVRDNLQPDDVLFHELVHAYRAMLGLFEFVPAGDAWSDTEEFFAIVLTNIYVSEIGRSGSLRGDHNSQFRSLAEGVGNDSDTNFYKGFDAERTRLIDQMVDEMPELTGVLSDSVPARRIGTWNPFRVRREDIDDRILSQRR